MKFKGLNYFERLNRILANVSALFKYPDIRKAINKDRDFFFFFPLWSFGGAERIHIDILNLVKDKNPLCLITERSKNNGFENEFRNVAEVINLERWSEKKAFKEHLFKKLASTINRQKKPVIFGWGSRFMYELIPYLEPHVRIIDLIHNFTDDGDGIEIFSLPYVDRIDQRIVVGKTIINQFEELYKVRQVSVKFLDRLMVIQNKVPFKNITLKKNFNEVITILFVARNSPEKRPDVFIKVAELCLRLNLPVQFKMIGDFTSYKANVPANLHIVGEIHDKDALNAHYEGAHLLLLTSTRESWGLVIFEGMNYGVVPISTNVGELADYISKEKQNGVLLNNLKDENELAQLFVKEIESFVNDRNLLKIFSKNAFHTIREVSSQDRFDKKYLELLRLNK